MLAWEKISRSKVKEGVGLRDWHLMNEALGAKLVWNIYTNPDLLWVKILKEKYLDSMEDNRIFTIKNPIKGSAIWIFIVACRPVIVDHITWQIGDGLKAKFWDDSWNGYPILKDVDGSQDLRQFLIQKWVIKYATT